MRLKIHWLPFHLADSVVRSTLEEYGKVEEITRETWRVEGFEGVETTTRFVRLTLKEGVKLEQLPHQLRIMDGNALIVVPGRPPLCLRCKFTGHVRKDCRVPRCDGCRRFGHVKIDCVRTYATVTNQKVVEDVCENTMDELEAEMCATSAKSVSDDPCAANTTPTASSNAPDAPEEGEPENNLPSSCEDVPEKTPSPAVPTVEDTPFEADACTPSEQEATAEGEVRVTEPAVPAATREQPSAKSGRRRTESAASQGSVDGATPGVEATRNHSKEPTGPRPTLLGKVTKKPRYNPPPNIPVDDRRKKPS